jgi:prevent-host-death family protein
MHNSSTAERLCPEETISTIKAKQRFSEIIDRAAQDKERVILTRRGKPIAAVVPIEDVELLEALEDRIDVEEAEKAEVEAAAKGEAPIPWEQARKTLDA